MPIDVTLIVLCGHVWRMRSKDTQENLRWSTFIKRQPKIWLKYFSFEFISEAGPCLIIKIVKDVKKE